MTGELYEVLGTAHRPAPFARRRRDGPGDRGRRLAPAWAPGIDNPELLTSLLFRTRAAALLSGKGPDWCSGYLSGLLVGAEIGEPPRLDRRRRHPAHRLGAPRPDSTPRPSTASGIGAEPIDAADATLAGLKAARKAAA